MDPAKLAEQVIQELARHRSRNDIILSICQTTGMKWAEAERFIHQVEINQGETIAARQRPLLVMLALAGVLGGLIASVGMVLATVDGWIVLFLNFPIPYLGNVVYFALGVLATVGSFIGLRSALRGQTPL